mgnify:CR=1 FL=1
MRVEKEYSPYSLVIGVVIISTSISEGEAGLKKNELSKFNFGKYSVNWLGGFGILEAKLYPMAEKYLFIMSGKSEGLCDTWLVLGHLRAVISLRGLFTQPKRLLMPSHIFLVLLKFAWKYLWKYLFLFLLIRVSIKILLV